MKNKRIQKLKLLCIMLPVLLLFTQCVPQVKDYIQGTYISEWTTEFTTARDTISIDAPDAAGSKIYGIIRRTCMLYQQKPQYKIVHWTGIYNSDNKTILINNNGRLLSFNPQQKEMKMGSTVYKKL